MPIAATAQVHPTAILTGEIHLGENVRIGPYAILEGPITLGDDCEVGPHAQLKGPLLMGRGNKVYGGAMLGSDPQHLTYTGQPTRLEIGDANTFREGSSIHRGSHVEEVTRIGHRNFFMVNSHVGHDCHVGNDCIMANGALIAGHCRLADGIFVSGNAAMHQFARIGRLAMASGGALVLRDLLPFMVCYGRAFVGGVNVVGMRRAGIKRADIDAVRQAYQMIYRTGSIIKVAIDTVEQELGSNPVVMEIVTFARGTKRGIMSRSGHDMEE